MAVALMLSAFHLFNYLNYTFLIGYFNPPLARSVLLVSCSLVLIVTSARNLGFHLARSWDMYLLCLLALSSAIFAVDPARTLKYAAWLTLAVYVGTELAARVKAPRDIATTLLIVLLPTTFLVALSNVALGPVVTSTGRRFGALGSTHVDTAFAMNFICLFLALKAMPAAGLSPPRWLRLAMLGALLWSAYQAVFGLTRSVWLGVILAVTLYYFRGRLTLRTLSGSLLGVVLIIVAIDVIGFNRLLPEEVKGRIEVTEERYESGEIDPRIEGIRQGLRSAMADPFGVGYAMESSHNSYIDILLGLGWLGFLLALLAIGRSALMVYRRAFDWFIFYAIGSAALLLHAFFEVQTLPGQANFVPLLLWYALSRSRFVRDPDAGKRRRPTFVGP